MKHSMLATVLERAQYQRPAVDPEPTGSVFCRVKLSEIGLMRCGLYQEAGCHCAGQASAEEIATLKMRMSTGGQGSVCKICQRETSGRGELCRSCSQQARQREGR